MTKRIEEELIEMNRLKRLELEFLFFRARMDETMLQKFRKALTNETKISKDPDLQYVWFPLSPNYIDPFFANHNNEEFFYFLP